MGRAPGEVFTQDAFCRAMRRRGIDVTEKGAPRCACGGERRPSGNHCVDCHREAQKRYRARKAAELREYIDGLRKRIRALEAENAELRRGV